MVVQGRIRIVGPGRARLVDSSCRKYPKISPEAGSSLESALQNSAAVYSRLRYLVQMVVDGGSY